MVLSRAARKLAAMLGICAIIFAQIAVAAHACNVLAEGFPASAMAMPADAREAPCESTDASPQNVCLHHCQGGPQTVDQQPAAPAVPAAVIVGRLEPQGRIPASLQSTQSYSQALLARVTAPPPAVLNCCLRI